MKISEILLKNIDTIRENFEYARYHVFDYDKDNKQFIILYNELKEILDGGNDDNYEGVPLILKNNDYEAFEDMGNEANNVQDENIHKKNELEKYWLNLTYKEDARFYRTP